MTYIFLFFYLKNSFPNIFQGSDDSVEANAFDDIKSLIKVKCNKYVLCALLLYINGEKFNIYGKENDLYILDVKIG